VFDREFASEFKTLKLDTKGQTGHTLSPKSRQQLKNTLALLDKYKQNDLYPPQGYIHASYLSINSWLKKHH